MTLPIDQVMAGVAWEAVPHVATDSGLPYATHSGVLEILGSKLRVYRLSDGRAIINADDLDKFFFGQEGASS